MLLVNFNSLILIVILNKSSPRLLPPCQLILAFLTYLSGSLPLTRLILRLVRTKSNSVIQWFRTCNYNTPLSHFPFFHPSLSFIVFLTPSPIVLANTSDGSPNKPTISLSCSPSSLPIQTPHLSPPHHDIRLTFPNILFLPTLYAGHLSTTCCSFSTSPSLHFWHISSCAVLPILFLKPSDPALILSSFSPTL